MARAAPVRDMSGLLINMISYQTAIDLMLPSRTNMKVWQASRHFSQRRDQTAQYVCMWTLSAGLELEGRRAASCSAHAK